MRGMVAALLVATIAAPVRAAAPQEAHGIFVSRSYALTFTVPRGLTYCRVPGDWAGSDHGTVLFLLPPTSCGDVGFASMARGFEPATVPRIEVYYGRTNGIHHAEPCLDVGRIRFLGRVRPLCRSAWRDMATREVRGLYVADDETEAVFTLVSYPSRLRRDLAVFRALTATVRVCAVPWQDAEGRPRIEGSGRSCPMEGDFY